jgi:ketosteroid isomerase-like protein
MSTNPPDAPAADADADGVEQELLATADRWREAIVANDAGRIATFVTDDWVIVDGSGVSPGTRLLRLVASGELTHSAMGVVGHTRIRVLGATALLTARITNTAHYGGRRFDADEWTTDVFVRRGGRWLCALTHYTSAAADAPS